MLLLSDKIPNFAPRNYGPLISGATQMPIGKQSYESCAIRGSIGLFSSSYFIIFIFYVLLFNFY